MRPDTTNIENPNRAARLGVYAFSHFCVDFACVYFLFAWFTVTQTLPADLLGITGSPLSLEVSGGFLLYSVLAFGTQAPLGLLCDARPTLPIAPCGCALVALGLLCTPLPLLGVMLLGLGNSCFHVGGGIDSLRLARGKLTRSGLFVSTGALGVASGVILGGSAPSTGWLPLVLIGASLVLTLLVCNRRKSAVEKTNGGQDSANPAAPPFGITIPKRAAALVILGAFAMVFVRSLVGSFVPMEWKTTVFLILLASAAAAGGKALGGILADRWGARRVGTASLLGALLCFVLGNVNPWVCCAGVLLLNMSMPITLCMLADRLPKNPGFAFGLASLAIVLGSFPLYLWGNASWTALIIVSLLGAAGLALVFLSAHPAKEGTGNDDTASNYQ